MHLTPGVYYLQWIATGHDPVSETWTLKLHCLADSLLGGVSGSGPALNLTLIAPGTPNFSSTAPDTATISGPAPSPPARRVPRQPRHRDR